MVVGINVVNKLCMSMIFQINAESEKSKEIMNNRIKKELENVLGKSNLIKYQLTPQ